MTSERCREPLEWQLRSFLQPPIKGASRDNQATSEALGGQIAVSNQLIGQIARDPQEARSFRDGVDVRLVPRPRPLVRCARWIARKHGGAPWFALVLSGTVRQSYARPQPPSNDVVSDRIPVNDPENIEIARVIDRVDDPNVLPSTTVRVAVDDPRDDYVCLLWVSYPLGDLHCTSMRLAVRESAKKIRPSKFRNLAGALDTADKAVRGGGSKTLPRDKESIVVAWMDPERRILRPDQSDPLINLEELTARADPPARKLLQQPLDDRHYQEIARLYDEARDLDINIYAYIREHHNRAESTVRGWIAEARKRGFLPATLQGQKRGNHEPPPPVPKEAIIVETHTGGEGDT